ncbi:uncharacterized protein TNCV_5126671 [Trichonephila clavipes]|nr:uncharacterized protein TNCV_5126671 [Trichonephila clavipes]
MAAPGNASSASNKTENSKNENINLEALNATQSESNETSKFELPPPQLNTNWNVFTKTLANTENLSCRPALPQRLSPSQRTLFGDSQRNNVKASRPMTHSEPPYVQGELKHLLRERNKARKLWQFTRFPQHKTELNRLQNKIKRLVGQYRQQVWEEHLTSLDTEDGSLWGTARASGKRPPDFRP